MSTYVNGKKCSLAYQGFVTLPADFTEKVGKHIEELDLSYNNFSYLKFLFDFPNLTTLVLDHNNIQSHVKIPDSLPNLTTLWVNHNRITNLSIFISTIARSCPRLRMLSMMNNPAAPSYFNRGTYQQYMDYRYYVISKFPKLEIIDDKCVDKTEREEAERIYGKCVKKKRKTTTM